MTDEEIELYNAWKFRERLTAWEAASLYYGRNPTWDYWQGDDSLVHSMADSIVEWQDGILKMIDCELTFSYRDKVSRNELEKWFFSYGDSPAFLYPETWTKTEDSPQQQSDDKQGGSANDIHPKERRALLTIIAALFHRQKLDPNEKNTQGTLKRFIDLAGLSMDDKTVKRHREAVADMFPDIDYKQNGK